MTSSPSSVASIRRFNRFYTRKIGVLREGLLDSPFSLTEARVLYEIAHHPGITARALCDALELDPGYLSRMLARLRRRKLVGRERAANDGRQSHLSLTGLGRKAFAELNTRSGAQIEALVAHLPAAEQGRLVETMRTIEHLLAPPSAAQPAMTLREPRPGDLGWVVQRHGALYAQEYGWDATFEALVARIVADFGRKHDPARERCWIAELNGVPVGCVFLVRESDQVAKLRLLLVEPGARGAGVGRQLVGACVDFARSAGYRKISLWTNSVLHAARKLYERAGFRLAKTAPHHSFGHDLEGQDWELDLP